MGEEKNKAAATVFLIYLSSIRFIEACWGGLIVVVVVVSGGGGGRRFGEGSGAGLWSMVNCGYSDPHHTAVSPNVSMSACVWWRGKNQPGRKGEGEREESA